MIEDIQIAPIKVRRANCKKCKKKINRLKIRSCVKGELYWGYLCENCSREELEKMPKHIKKMNIKINEFSRMSNKEKKGYLNRLNILKELR